MCIMKDAQITCLGFPREGSQERDTGLVYHVGATFASNFGAAKVSKGRGGREGVFWRLEEHE